MSKNEKEQLRARLAEKRKSLCGRNKKSALITGNFLSSKLYEASEELFIYHSTAFEADTHEIIKQAFEDGKSVCLPRCEGRGEMNFFEVLPGQILSPGAFGIAEPQPCKERLRVPGKATLVVVPGLSFDKSGFRIGYGGGYYDRYLARFDFLSAGLCFEELLADRLPVDPTDVPVRYLVTEKTIYSFSGADNG